MVGPLLKHNRYCIIPVEQIGLQPFAQGVSYDYVITTGHNIAEGLRTKEC